MVELSPGWKFEYNSNEDIEQFLKNKLDKSDYDLIKDCHIVKKSDMWRLIKMQEFEEVLPEVVVTLEDGTKTVSYGNIIGLLIEGFKDHEQRILVLEKLLLK
jgi:hypothetical protein